MWCYCGRVRVECRRSSVWSRQRSGVESFPRQRSSPSPGSPQRSEPGRVEEYSRGDAGVIVIGPGQLQRILCLPLPTVVRGYGAPCSLQFSVWLRRLTQRLGQLSQVSSFASSHLHCNLRVFITFSLSLEWLLHCILHRGRDVAQYCVQRLLGAIAPRLLQCFVQPKK